MCEIFLQQRFLEVIYFHWRVPLVQNVAVGKDRIPLASMHLKQVNDFYATAAKLGGTTLLPTGCGTKGSKHTMSGIIKRESIEACHS
mmetsp:Transcript_3228/g.7150  ORF Transcript_3228/g.7150 Transcript_3228/m.7150 type:complete len:87 (-) Transcript_3228:80-340(-)